MKNIHFWVKWLFITCLIVIAYGLGLVFFSQSALFDLLINDRINMTFWGTTRVTPDILTFQSFIYSVLGATAAGWGILLAFMVQYPFRNKEKWAWNAIALAIATWFVLDTGYSVYYQAYINAIINTILLVALGLPLLVTRKEFMK